MMRSLTILLTFAFPMLGFSKDALEVGQAAPALTVTTDQGESLSLEEVYASGPVLVYFYPKADTPGCTAQACNLRDNFDELQEAGVTVLGVSRDEVKNQADFREKYALPFTLIADSDGTLGAGFGVEKIMAVGMFKRQSFLVVDGKVAWRDLAAKPGSQSSDVLAALKKAQAS